MNYRVRYLKLAQNDLSGIIEFNKRFSLKYQQAVINNIRQHCADLARNPEIARVYEANPKYRRMAVDDYLIFYQVDKENLLVSIYRILHGRRNICRIIESDKENS